MINPEALAHLLNRPEPMDPSEENNIRTLTRLLIMTEKRIAARVSDGKPVTNEHKEAASLRWALTRLVGTPPI